MSCRHVPVAIGIALLASTSAFAETPTAAERPPAVREPAVRGLPGPIVNGRHRQRRACHDAVGRARNPQPFCCGEPSP